MLLAQSAKAQSPVFDYNFPASWGGTGTTVTDQSSAGNNGFTTGTLSLDLAPPSSSGNSINTTAGGVLTSGNQLLNNSAVAAAGGFTYNVAFNWNGTDSVSFGHTEKIIDYAGTESLQLITTAGSANLQMTFANDTGAESIPVSTTILPNTWYHVSLAFNTTGNSLDVNGDISGVATLSVNGTPLSAGAATKGKYGDSLNRPIGIGQLGANYGYLVGFKGDIYDPNVQLGVVPEPSTMALGLMGGLGLLGMWKVRRKA
ncbi:MAG TPA: PEP-CTERM sorting domain-containing protein [Verrucomicrobiae bacterium]|nr:PEP-CTERM sorting domain-containing protein [Verrucomicrobiae bacterium]